MEEQNAVAGRDFGYPVLVLDGGELMFENTVKPCQGNFFRTCVWVSFRGQRKEEERERGTTVLPNNSSYHFPSAHQVSGTE